MQKEISFEKLVDFYKEVLSRLTDKRSGSRGFNFIFVCKQESHKTTYKDYIESGIKVDSLELQKRNSKGKL